MTATATPAASELVVEHLSLRFGGLTVLDDVSLQVARGELLALIGPNGAGKTSVLNCISGLYRGSGRITFAGSDITRLAPAQIARLGLGRTFQHGELFPHMSVLDNLMTARHARMRTSLLGELLFAPAVRTEEARHREKAEEIIEFVELERYRHVSVDDLPFGVQKIVGFARALTTEPRLLLLDEPSAGLNREGREDLARFILRIKHELKIPMVWIEHDMQMIADLADRVQVLHYGKTLAAGTPVQVLCDPGVIEAYLGRLAPDAT